jgi:hypothetical protein
MFDWNSLNENDDKVIDHFGQLFLLIWSHCEKLWQDFITSVHVCQVFERLWLWSLSLPTAGLWFGHCWTRQSLVVQCWKVPTYLGRHFKINTGNESKCFWIIRLIKSPIIVRITTAYIITYKSLVEAINFNFKSGDGLSFVAWYLSTHNRKSYSTCSIYCCAPCILTKLSTTYIEVFINHEYLNIARNSQWKKLRYWSTYIQAYLHGYWCT